MMAAINYTEFVCEGAVVACVIYPSICLEGMGKAQVTVFQSVSSVWQLCHEGVVTKICIMNIHHISACSQISSRIIIFFFLSWLHWKGANLNLYSFSRADFLHFIHLIFPFQAWAILESSVLFSSYLKEHNLFPSQESVT
jgi:hypothetical protein